MEMWDNIILTILSVSVPALTGYGLKMLSAYLEARTHSAKLQRAFETAADTAQSAVAQTSQTFCDALKGTPKWDAAAMKSAFDQSVGTAKQLIGADSQALIEQETGSFDVWLKTKIEQAVRAKA